MTGVQTCALPISDALGAAGIGVDDLGAVYLSASGDEARDAWEMRVLDATLGAAGPPRHALRRLVGDHAGAGALSVMAAAVTARASRRPCLVHGVARGGAHVALVVAP